ncbi:MAG TPA: DUF1574 domain-containing protein [Cyanobacteria bacterium UBA11149]|nr:DUF1574 domain-containing protein [Cyanobacteria bacterium UBA11367]HBE61151.1 DUF1574 domain-containing protein [Cyanobacteria bacterium UBA11366]HBK62637.1 DUF1574 domain-containing protein [Cyanobacteria bacterium UBA11166]HBR76703.1 DUF1574 domain-containing protein [Cyanobacteria bacterium UBA11159]HBS72360.1 DUF1574 domain-containing protein [Cyanobacteria bacterium UBA11153]HBW90685.1 DUF1574 domain-containing protein [Cyanobacteria bacterium UBA11149]HCA98251.1 DUF1574 domain-conta
MLDIERQTQSSRPSSLAQWAYKAIGQSGVYLRVRLRENSIHILCQSDRVLNGKKITQRLLEAINSQEGMGKFPIHRETPIDRIIIYGRSGNNERPDWIEQIQLKPPDKVGQNQSETSMETGTTHAAILVSHESLARSGSPSAIARYLSSSLSYLGVTIKVQIQTQKSKTGNRGTLKEAGATGHRGESLSQKSKVQSPNSSSVQKPTTNNQQRLWIICSANYSTDASLLVEPIVKQLRSLDLTEFREAAICSQVTGEAKPEWIVRVNLTPAVEMLEDWAQWGDIQALARILNQRLSHAEVIVRAVLKESTLHLFCSQAAIGQIKVPDKESTVGAIADILDLLAPQGIKAATVYGVESDRFSFELEPETPIWIDWLNLPAAEEPELAPTTFTLAQRGDLESLNFLLERLVNHNLDQRLATGGIQLKIRRKQDLLHIMSEGIICPPQSQIASPITKLLRDLAIQDIGGVRIYGRRAGETTPAWNYGSDFVTRRRQVVEVTPDFSPHEVGELVIPSSTSGEDVNEIEIEENQENFLKPYWDATVQTIGRWLCYTQIFVPTLDNQDLTSVSGRSTSVSAQGITVGIIWSTLGLLLTFQADWFTGQILGSRHLGEGDFSGNSQVLVPALSGKDDSPVTISIPEMSLQKRGVRTEDDFNASGFTRAGEQSIIIDRNTSGSDRTGAAQAAILAQARSDNPSFNNPLLDQKLALYQQRIIGQGVPDVLIMGSSRALRGVDPHVLQEELAAQGYTDVDIFNFAVNGATAQIVDLMIRRVLTPEQLPKLIIWADGARAFNSGRVDATYQAIENSEGYQKLNAGTFPNSTVIQSQNQDKNTQLKGSQSLDDWLNQSLTKISSTYPHRHYLKSSVRDRFVDLIQSRFPQTATPKRKESVAETSIDLDGFLPLSIRFDPATYYQNHPRVAGAYDGDYQSFELKGQQENALETLLRFAKENNINIVFVNLPLNRDYLDPVRSKYEIQFQQYMRSNPVEKGLIFRNLSNLLLDKPDHFSDPSHLNRYGAYQVSKQLAKDPMIPWSLVISR